MTHKTAEKRRQQVRLRMAEARAFVQSLKDVPCADCGNRYPPCVMDFDHREPSEKQFLISNSYSRSIEAIKLEIAKCDVVCANCHRLRHELKWED